MVSLLANGDRVGRWCLIVFSADIVRLSAGPFLVCTILQGLQLEVQSDRTRSDRLSSIFG